MCFIVKSFFTIDKHNTLVYTLYMNNNLKLTTKQMEAMRYIRNCIVHFGKTPSVREIMRKLDYNSPQSATLIINGLIKKGLLKKRENGTIQLIRDLEEKLYHAQTINVPIVGVVACGTPILAKENIEGYIPVSTRLAKANHKYFLLRASGDSMDKAGINDGDLVLVKQQPTADEGDKVVALIDDGATVKKFHKTEEAIVLKPQSNNPAHKPIVLTEDFQVQGIVVATLSNF